ncbi:MAG: HNH endonuclease [Oscillospiraceae bacterium]|nr:HNH endonuclease [Oscillospiraceae bacterium]
MVKLNKSVLQDGVTIKCPNDYQTGPIFQLLFRDCYGKCYICEQVPIQYVVEHIVAHRGNLDLKYSWINLLLACSYCNNVKNRAEFYDGIINPTETDPEDVFSLELSFDGLREKVIVTVINQVENKMLADKTAKLLDLVYNNSSVRDNQKVSSANLRNKLSRNIRDFYVLIANYKAEHDDGNYNCILDEISRKSEFAAFKRVIVRSDPELLCDFEKVLL